MKKNIKKTLSYLLLISIFVTATLHGAEEDFTHAPGHTRVLQVPRIDTTQKNFIETVEESDRPGDQGPVTAGIKIDGKLNEPMWDLAAIATDFWVSNQERPPTDQTEVLVMMDENNIYFGFRVYESVRDSIQAVQTVRDVGLSYDDTVSVEIDSFFNRRDISKFSVNAIGTQDDDIAGGRSSKIEWKGDWYAATTRTGGGWSAEFAIPLSILNYHEGQSTFGVNFSRYQNRTKEKSYWADVTPQGLEEEMGQLTGLELPPSSAKKNWTFMPYILAGKNIPDKRGKVQNELVTGGMNVRYQPRPDLTGMLSLYPDFSQVEEAVTDISFSYSEKFVPDNRPFFIEGDDYFGEDQYFYSNRVPDFNIGGKSFGRLGKTQFGVLATSAYDNQYDIVARSLQELDDTHQAFMQMVASEQPELDNFLAVAQFSGRQKSGLKYSTDVAITDTKRKISDPSIPEGTGSQFAGSLGWASNYWYVDFKADRYDDTYFPKNGRLDDELPGTHAVGASAGYYREQTGSFWKSVDSYIGYKYRETNSGELQSRSPYLSVNLEFNNEMRFGLYAQEGPYRPTEDEPGEFKDFLYDDQYYSTSLDFNTRSSRFAYGIKYDWGNLSSGDYKYTKGYMWWRPIDTIYLRLETERTELFGVYEQSVLVGSWDVTPQSSLATRYINGGGEHSFRLAYGRRARKGFDIFAVYNKEPDSDAEFSIKFVYTIKK